MVSVVWLLLGAATAVPTFQVSWVSQNATVGRVRLYLTKANEREGGGGCVGQQPRLSGSDMQDTAQIFGVDVGVDVEVHGSSMSATITESTLGYPRHSLSNVPAGRYCIQAELFRYDVYRRGDGFNLTLPVSCVSNQGNDGGYDSPDGTLYSDVKAIVFDPSLSDTISVSLGHEVEPKPSPGCTGYGPASSYIKTVNVRSALLSKFWGKDITLQACVLLPYGFHEHPNAKYPLLLAHGHYSAIFNPGGRFDPHPPTDNETGYDRVDQLYANWFYGNWTSPTGPFKHARALVITINHPVPFFDDSYAVDSANVGPYGTAVMKELLPTVEKQYRGIGQGWARGVLGGSTGGWESLASQVLYPDEFNYAAIACPDPIGFASYVTINLYKDRNAYWYDSDFKRTPRPGVRDSYSGTSVIPSTSTPTYGHPYGQTSATVEEMNRHEMVLGAHSRSCGQWDIWEAVFGPKGEDGYPKRIWCKDPQANCTYGEIDHEVAQYWKEHFDLTSIMKANWHKGLGQKLSGKLHLFVGASDTYFLTDAVMDFQDWVETVSDPPFNGTITIGAHNGRGYEHCFNGFLPNGTVAPNSITRELYVTKFLPRMAQRWADTAPKDADMEWHSY